MSFSFTSNTIEEIKRQIDIVDIIGRTVSLKKQGTNYKGLCPFHGEKTPSFVVSQEKQIFTCFGCGISGDAIEFVKKYYNLDFGEAVKKIAKEQGIEIQLSKYDDNRKDYYKANQIAAKFFFESFTKEANIGYRYMENRKIEPAILKKFGIGYADEKWDSLYKWLKDNEISEKIMVELGLVSHSKGKFYDRFRNRVMFPIINTSGKVVGFGGRALSREENAKYINSPENPIFHKSNNLFSLNFARNSLRKIDYLIVVEGYMDVIALYQSGIENVVASLGTALTETHGKILKRYVNKVVLSYDSDKAGREAALKACDILYKEGLDVRVLHVDQGKDPDDYIKEKGKEQFLNLVNKAIPAIDYQLMHMGKGYNLYNDQDKIGYIKKVQPFLRNLDSVEQEIYSQKLGKLLNVSPRSIMVQDHGELDKPIRSEIKEETSSIREELSGIEKTLIKIMFMEPTYINKILKYEDIFISSLGREILNLLYGEYEKNQDFIDEKKIKDSLEPKDEAVVEEIIKNIKITDPKDVLNDCIKKWEVIKLKKNEKQLLDLLSLADENAETNQIENLQKNLIEVQRKIKLQQGEPI